MCCVRVESTGVEPACAVCRTAVLPLDDEPHVLRTENRGCWWRQKTHFLASCCWTTAVELPGRQTGVAPVSPGSRSSSCQRLGKECDEDVVVEQSVFYGALPFELWARKSGPCGARTRTSGFPCAK